MDLGLLRKIDQKEKYTFPDNLPHYFDEKETNQVNKTKTIYFDNRSALTRGKRTTVMVAVDRVSHGSDGSDGLDLSVSV